MRARRGAQPGVSAGALMPDQARALHDLTRAALERELAPERVVETHAALVFLTADRAFKLKKPVTRSHLDFSTAPRRLVACLSELRLNRPLAAETYLGVAPVRRAPSGRIGLDTPGEVIDRVVVMRRLPEARNLETILKSGRPCPPLWRDALGERMAQFLRAAPPLPPGRAARHWSFMFAEARRSRDALARWDADLGPEAAEVGRGAVAALAYRRREVMGRVADRLVVEGHGDLRPEHVCFTDPVTVFDRVEFCIDLRIADPFDEAAYLGLESEILGDADLGPALTARLEKEGIAPPSPGLAALYRVLRCLTRARLSMDHLLDPDPRTPGKWAPAARRYLALARQALRAAED